MYGKVMLPMQKESMEKHEKQTVADLLYVAQTCLLKLNILQLSQVV